MVGTGPAFASLGCGTHTTSLTVASLASRVHSVFRLSLGPRLNCGYGVLGALLGSDPLQGLGETPLPVSPPCFRHRFFEEVD